MGTGTDHFIIEGIDRLGKSSLIKGINHTYGFHLYLHYEAPKKLSCYKYRGTGHSKYDLKSYQEDSFTQGFNLLNTNTKTVFDRFHLGEYVYSELYRDYSGEYVFDMEKVYCINYPGGGNMMASPMAKNTRLILLTTSDFSIIEDDGGNFDFNRKEEEQERFIEAFNMSKFPIKVMVDVADGNGGFRPFTDILKEALDEKNVVDIKEAEYVARYGYPEERISNSETYND